MLKKWISCHSETSTVFPWFCVKTSNSSTAFLIIIIPIIIINYHHINIIIINFIWSNELRFSRRRFRSIITSGIVCSDRSGTCSFNQTVRELTWEAPSLTPKPRVKPRLTRTLAYHQYHWHKGNRGQWSFNTLSINISSLGSITMHVHVSRFNWTRVVIVFIIDPHQKQHKNKHNDLNPV